VAAPTRGEAVEQGRRSRTSPQRTSATALLLATLAAPLTSGCVKNLPEEAFARGDVAVDCCGRSDEPIEIVFLGVAGWLLRKGEEAVLTAPLFSNPGFLRAGVLPIRPDTARIERHLPDVRSVSAILVGHGHYDHLMDVPYVALTRAPRAVIYANETSVHQLAPFGLPPGRVRRIEETEVGSVEREGSWIQVGPRARVMPLLSDHGPHFAGVTLYSGVRRRDMEEPPADATEWLDGETLAYLIDLLNEDGSVALRVYFQDAVAAPPYGLVPPMSDGVQVDVALIVPATYAEVRWHPEALLGSAPPRQVILGHWEDFFRSPDLPVRPVRFTLLPDFVARLERALPEGAEWHLPLPGTRFRLD
jgi:hypothetical protein